MGYAFHSMLFFKKVLIIFLGNYKLDYKFQIVVRPAAINFSNQTMKGYKTPDHSEDYSQPRTLAFLGVLEHAL